MSPALRVALSIARHARPLLGRAVLEQAGEDLGGDAARQQLGEDRLLVGLVLVEPALAAGLEGGGDQLAGGRHLGDHRLEAVVEQRGDVELAGVEAVQHVACDRRGLAVADPAHLAEVDVADEDAAEVAAQLLAALLADGQDLDGLALGEEAGGVGAREADDRRVEAAAEAALGGRDDQQVGVGAAGAAEQARRRGARGDAGGEVAEDGFHAAGIGPGGLGGLLGAAQLGGRHHLHRLGDLARGLHAGDADLQVLEARHARLSSLGPVGHRSRDGARRAGDHAILRRRTWRSGRWR